jgi:oligosaccharide repeat unit polymerase
MDALLFNAILFVFTWLIFFIKFRRLNVFLFLLLAYTLNAIFAYYIVKEGYYFVVDPQIGQKVSIVPLLLHYFATLLVCSPFYSFDERKIKFNVIIENKYIKLIVYASIFWLTCYSLLKLGETLVVRTLDLGEVYQDNHDGEAPLFTYSNPLLFLLNGTGGKLNNVMKYFLISYFMAKLVNSKEHWIKSTIWLLLCVAPSVFAAMAGANRGGLFFTAFDIMFFYVVIHSFLSPKLRFKLYLVAGAIGLYVLLPYVASITESRFENSKEGTEGSVYRYFGESLVNWSYQNYGKVKQHTCGQWTFPEFGPNIPQLKYASGFYDYYSKVTGISTALFGTLYGDCYMEFGYIGGYVFLALIVLLARRYIFKYKREYAFLPMIAVYYYFALCGIFGISYRELTSRIYILLLYFLCRYVYKTTLKRNKRHLLVSNSGSQNL